MIISIQTIDNKRIVRVRNSILGIDKIFDSGNIEKDYRDAVEYSDSASGIVYLSSSCDEFVDIHSNEYMWSDTGYIVKKAEKPKWLNQFI